MDKAIKFLNDLDCFTSEFRQERNDALAELTAHKAKIDEIKEWCDIHSKNTAATKYEKYWKGYQECAIFILQKLEELTSESAND